jgi:hypothetical protein
MIKLVVATALIVAVGLPGAASAAGKRAKPAAVVAEPPAAVAVQDCSVFYDDYAQRGFGWGSGPGHSVGFGTFEGALPRYPPNSFPNWYGICREWGHYSSAGSTHW